MMLLVVLLRLESKPQDKLYVILNRILLFLVVVFVFTEIEALQFGGLFDGPFIYCPCKALEFMSSKDKTQIAQRDLNWITTIINVLYCCFERQLRS